MDDEQYARDMIAHHREAIRMSEDVLSGEPDPEIKSFAKRVIEAQSAEVKMLQSWLKKDMDD